MSAVSGWPSSPLDAAQRAFTLLVHPPTQVGFDGRGVDGLPRRILPLDELRRLLLSPATSPGVRDVVWRELVVRSRRDGPAWVVAAVGMALPGLRHTAGQLAGQQPGPRQPGERCNLGDRPAFRQSRENVSITGEQDPDIDSEPAQRRRQRAGDIGQAPGLYQRRAFGGGEQDARRHFGHGLRRGAVSISVAPRTNCLLP